MIRRPLTRLVALAATLALLLPMGPARAQTAEVKYIALRYNLDRPDANPVFCNSLGANGALDMAWAGGPSRVTTVGSSTTVTELAASSLPFRDLAVKDTIRVLRGAPGPTTMDIVAITAKASGASITVDTAVDWSNGVLGQKFDYRKHVCGQTAADGWFSVAAYADFTVVIQYQQGDLTGGLSWMVQCRDGGVDSSPVQVFPVTLGSYQVIATASTTATTASNALAGFERWNDCRVAMFATTADPSDAGANLERIRVVVLGTPRGI